MALQAITIADQHYERARDSVDFIQRRIFPGSCIPSVAALSAAMARAGDLRTIHLEDIGPHYATTLAAWRRRLYERWDDALAIGLDERFLRLWEFYFVYCEGGFLERRISDVAAHDPSAGSSSPTIKQATPVPRTRSAVRALHTTAAAPESRSMCASRCSGYAGSSGRYAAPASSTPSRATGSSRERSMHTPTMGVSGGVSGPASSPTPASRRASALARRTSSA
jgi:hypothetical protein